MHIPGRLVWLESVANEVCAIVALTPSLSHSLVWGDQALYKHPASAAWAGCAGPGAGSGPCSTSWVTGGECQQDSAARPALAHWWLVTPSPLSPHEHQQLELATAVREGDWVISPSHPRVIWTHQPGLSPRVSWDRSWLLAFLTPKSPWPAGLTRSGHSVGKNHAIRKI